MKQGGSYVVEKPGDKPRLVECTKDHAEGNCARDKRGKPISAQHRSKATTTQKAGS